MISAAAEVQRRLWGTDPRAWADLAEAHNQPLFEAVRDVLQRTLAQFQDPATGGVTLANTFRWVAACR